MSDATLSDIDFKNEMVWAWITLIKIFRGWFTYHKGAIWAQQSLWSEIHAPEPVGPHQTGWCGAVLRCLRWRTAPVPINLFKKPKNIAPTRTERCADQAVRGSLTAISELALKHLVFSWKNNYVRVRPTLIFMLSAIISHLESKLPNFLCE